jgi:ribosome-associated toxin RatA of RatAB toxin-antitoxin module
LHSRIDLDVDASAARVFELAADVRRWPQLLPHYQRVTVLSQTATNLIATFRAVRALGPIGIPVAWRSRCWSESDDANDLRLRFVHIRGATRGMDVTWHIVPRDGGCHVAIEHDFVRPLPLLGRDVAPRVIDRMFVEPIASRTLRTFKALAETS